jgi:hypothetical protein
MASLRRVAHIIVLIIHLSPVIHMASKHKSNDVEGRTKRLRAAQDCMAAGRCSKSTLAKMLQTLHKNGMLSDGMGSQSYRQIRSELKVAIEFHSNAMTPYGKVVQTLSLPFEKMPTWDIAHPKALMYHLSRISKEFSELMRSVLRPGEPCLIILYMDEVVPGNVFLHHKGRKFWAIYWALLDWPEWILSRAECWPCFGIILSKACENIPGDIASLLPVILKQFIEPNQEVSTVLIVNQSKELMVAWTFRGYIADLDGHAKTGSIKTVGGTIPCITCANIVQFLDTSRTKFLIGLDCTEPSRFVHNTDKDIYDKADQIRDAVEAGLPIDTLCMKSGIIYNPKSVLLDKEVRTIWKPVTHCIRDPMHCLVQDGVAGTEIAMVCQRLDDNDIRIKKVWDFSQTFRLPRSRGSKPPAQWFNDKFVKPHSVQAFASEQLSIIPILMMFLQFIVTPLGIMEEEIKCFGMLDDLMSYLALGAEQAMKHVCKIRSLIYHHGKLFQKLYPDQIRPKFHHLYHIPDNMSFIRRLITCFVLERKHIQLKDAAREVLRYVESVVIADVVNRMCTHMSGVESLFQRRFLVSPCHTVSPMGSFYSAATARLPIGLVHASDLIYLSDRTVGFATRFFTMANDDSLLVRVDVLTRVSNELWSTEIVGTIFVDSDSIVAAIMWATVEGNVIHIVVPVLYR